MKSKRTSARSARASGHAIADPETAPPPDLTPEHPEKQPTDGADITRSIPVVGVGSSAGGLEALNQLLTHLPPDTGLAFVLIQHLSPDRESLLPQILAKKTRMKVREAEDGSVLEPNTVFVLPADKQMAVSHGVLSLTPRPVSTVHHPIDHFLRSLAADQRSRAIAVILSGSGSDGTLGVQAVKEENGVVFAQDEESAQQFGMPQSAIATGCVDFVLNPEGIAKQLARLGRHPYLGQAETSPASVPEKQPQEGGDFKQILGLMRTRFRVDFSHYHPATILRRLRRRVMLSGLGSTAEYAARVFESETEGAALFKDLLIKTTRFFRDPDTFEYLQQNVLPSLLKAHAAGDAQERLRVWIPACATGEEAYSLAIALTEASESSRIYCGLQLFASDVSEEAVNHARKGRYPENISADVSAERLRRFFTRYGDIYEVDTDLRKMFVFAKHDLLREPPFSRMDLISCRNLLIYLGPEAQKRVLSALHYALKPGGALVLGDAEGVNQAAHLFHQVHPAHKIFTKQPAEERFILTGTPRLQQAEEKMRAAPLRGGTAQTEADRITLQRFSFPSFLVNEDLTILQFRGDTGVYMHPSAGKATYNIMDMLPEELRPAIRAMIANAKKDGTPVKRVGLRVNAGGSARSVNLEVVPIHAESSTDRSYLVVLQEESQRVSERKSHAAGPIDRKDRDVVSELKKELAETLTELKSLVEDHRAALEELQAANEELQSANEELQSNNEELETGKEEIEATNEELLTTNTELQFRNRELAELSKFIGSVFDSVREPLVVLDSDLRVRQANRSFFDQFGLTSSKTIGRTLAELGAHQWAVPELTERLEKVFAQQSAFESFEMDAAFPGIGRRKLRLNAHSIRFVDEQAAMALLAIEDRTSEHTISEQQKVIRELSTPVLRVGNRMLILPIIGSLDLDRMQQLTKHLLGAVHGHRAKVAVLDLTGAATIDSHIAQGLLQTAAAARLLGATVIFSGISRETSAALSTLGFNPSDITTVSDLQRGLEEANAVLGLEVITRRELLALRDAMRELHALREAEASEQASG